MNDKDEKKKRKVCDDPCDVTGCPIHPDHDDFGIVKQLICADKCDITACPNHPEYIPGGCRIGVHPYSLKGISPYCVYLRDGSINYSSPAVCCNYVDYEESIAYHFPVGNTDGEHYACYMYGDCVWKKRLNKANGKKDFPYSFMVESLFKNSYYGKKYLECDLSNLRLPCCRFNKQCYITQFVKTSYPLQILPNPDSIDKDGNWHYIGEDCKQKDWGAEADIASQDFPQPDRTLYDEICKIEIERTEREREQYRKETEEIFKDCVIDDENDLPF